ncbi:MAG: hypothetical protein ACJ8FY_07280 [Gemmataceae bacterium]
MIDRRYVNAFLASIISLGAGVAVTRADDIKAPPTVTPAMPAITPVPAPQLTPPLVDAPVTYEHLFREAGALGPAIGPRKVPGGYNLCGPRCWSDPSTIGAGNLRTELFFGFSSSRAFFGEPCLPPPPGVDAERHHHLRFRGRH